MIPESSTNDSITLYRAEHFPDKWVKETDLLKGEKYVDSTVFQHGDEDVYKRQEQFLRSIYMDGIMRVSYIEKNSEGKITSIIGPLEKYKDYIVKLDLSHRRAVVEIPFFKQDCRMKFGLWCEKDAKIPWIEEEKRLRKNHIEEVCRVCLLYTSMQNMS